jgi:DNA (cytosine-5)-methyltransferase 1
MKHGSLFSGIGGFDLAAQWMGWENVFHCEWNPFGRRVLSHYWPKSTSYNDITKTDFTAHSGEIDILTGGFPCQPYSSAGKQKGKEDDRHLWPEMLRAIREISPRYVVGENVRGLTNWNGGLVFDEVQADLEAQGYEVIPFLLPACSVNAPHRRDRIWFIAYAGGNGHEQRGFNEDRREKGQSEREGNKRERLRPDTGRISEQATFANPTSSGWIQGNKGQRTKQFASRISDWQIFPTQSPVCGGNDGLPTELDRITLSRHRRESIKAYGNAIVPQVAYQIFKAIQATTP